MGARNEDGPLAYAMRLIGDWWTLELLHDALDGNTHFEEFRDNLKIAPNVLANRLSTLVRTGLMDHLPSESGPRHDAYVLTDLGRALRPVLLALTAWVNDRLPPERRSVVLVDAATGREVEPVLVDRVTGRRVDTGAHVLTAGPAAGPEVRARYTARHSG
ncbi:HxlR family transcriptional regulator [Streptomyces sulfonofaciens]|uniref:HxlR family transcriptional regulator n=1 Tax=Streptomyces sulfonofaciens TaxID=68272 RepID=A0A919L5Y9_9ACTN|nr:helix-turn-helix domain-containing protein [Streptomyces sulfonofaciens]GHH85168.1 HxlR family transcriptional regulator [Streptomyces sulfonofaciens]